MHQAAGHGLVDDALIPDLLLRAERLFVARDAARRRFRAAGGHRVDADAVLRMLHRQAGRHGVDAALGGRIRNAVNAAGGDRRDVDDHALLARHHVRQHGAAAPQRGEQRAPDFRLDLLGRIFLVGLGPDGAADVIDQHIDPAVGGQCGRDQLFGAGPGFQVHPGHQRQRAQGLHFGRHFLHQLRTVGQHQLRALLRQRQGHAAAYALGCARDDDNLSFKTPCTHAATSLLAENFSK